ncbi:DUF5979 domain-containing protein [Varibaculum prostatecancerukia]|uniref:DUF5979 domain-containing protein n=1 Tax=Varibaculum prostatecancerukia TaxID=2811781 RepID=UPI001C005D5B|nr:DUF5979 domain-containing protein [Varibaculum prostatecancerukia]
MAGHKRYQKLTAVLTLLGLVLALIPVAVLALPKAQAEPSDPAHPIIGGADDPWPSDPPREAESQDIKSAGSIALVFEMGSFYGYQTMGGAVPGTNWNTPCPRDYGDAIPDSRKRLSDGKCRNWDQNRAVANVIEKLKGSPLSIGIYHYARKQDEGAWGNNTPDLQATSLADEAGYNKVMNKVWSLDATNGKGGNLATKFGGNSEWGLGKLYMDMLRYRQQQLKEHAGDPDFEPRPLYSKIIIMSVSDPHWHLSKSIYNRNKDVWQINHYVDGESDEDQLNQDLISKDLDTPSKNFVDDPDNKDSEDDHAWKFNDFPLTANPGRLGMLDVARRIRNLGGDIRTMGMGTWVKNFNTRAAFLRALTGVADPKQDSPNYQYIEFNHDNNSNQPNGWFDKNGEYYKTNTKDGIANGTFEQTMRRWMWEDTHLSLTSDLVDQDFRYVKPNAGQRIDFTPTDTSVKSQYYTTGKDGRVVISLTKAKMTGGVDVTFPRHTTEYWHTKLNGKNVRCQGLSRATGDSEVFTPEEINDPAHERVGFKIPANKISELFSIKCATYSRPLQKLTFEKTVSTVNDQIRYEVGGKPPHYTNGAKYSYKWECKDPLGDKPDEYVVPPTVAGPQQVKELNIIAKLGKLQITPTPVPVGTQCTITETIEMPEGYDVTTASMKFTSDSYFIGTNFAVDEAQTQKIKDQKQSVKNIIVGKIKLQDPTVTTEKDSQLVSHTVYNSLRAHVEVTLHFSNSKNDPALAKKIAEGKLPKKVPVYYNCRFMADPTKLPELPETNTGTYPGYVGVDWVGVKPDGTAKVILGQDKNGKDAWPVGTHCLLSTVPPNQNIHGPGTDVGESVNIPGVVVRDSYESTICQADHDSKPTTPKACSNNYFWVHSPGKQIINITEDLQRLEGKLRVTKELTGEAASQGIGQDFPMHLKCTDEGVTVPIDGQDTASFGVKSTESKLVEKVPAGVRCDLTEDSIGAPAAVPNAQLVMPGPISTTITDTTIETPVNVKNDLSYKLANLAINHKIAWGSPTPDSAMQSTIKGKNNKVTVSCKLPGEAGQTVNELVIPANGNEKTSKSLENLPVGSQCTIQSEPQDIAGLNVRYQAPPQTVTITESGSTANLETKYSLPGSGEISVQGLVKSRPQYDALKIPDTLDAQVKCTNGGTDRAPVPVTLDLKNGTSTIVDSTNIPEGSDCRVEAPLADLEGRIDWKWANVDDINQANAGPINTQFTSPSGSGSVSVVIRLWAKAKTTTVNLAAHSSMWTSKDANSTANGDRITVPDEWRQAVLGIAPNDADSTKVPLEVKCQYKNGAVTSTATFSPELSNGGTVTPLEVPANWDCTATTNEATLKIPGTDLQDPAWTGAGGTASADKYSYQWTSADGQSIALQRDYRLQLATFNLKKKVGGEGVTIVSGDKHFPVSWSCSLNGKPINIPAPRDIGLNTDAQATFGNDLPSRLKESNLHPSASTEMGRFQQGEWHVIDALPAGAVCTVTEDPAGAKVDETVWSHYWEITNGYRGRDREGNEKCTDASDKCRAENVGGEIQVKVLLPRDKKAGKNEAFIPNDPHNPTVGDNLKDANGDPRNPVVPSTLPENFAGAMVSWNNYVFEKTQVKVSLTNTGNGAPLARGKTFDARLYCGPPPLIGAGDAELPPDSSAAAIIRVALSFKESATEPGKWEDAVANQLIPVGYRCVLAEEKFPELDAKVTTTIEKDPTQDTQTADAAGLRGLFSYNKGKNSQVDDDSNLNLMSGDQGIVGFIVHPNHVSGQGSTQKQSLFTINNDFVRPAAKLKVVQKVRKDDAASYMSVGQALVDKGEVGYKAHYQCTDKYLRDDQGNPKVYEGSMDLSANDKTTLSTGELTLLSGEDGGNFVPASSTCKIWHENQAEKDPVAKYTNPQVYLNPSAKVVTEGATEQTEALGNSQTPGVLKVTPLSLDPEGKKETTITFEDFYLVPFDQYQIGTAVEGKRRDEVLPETNKYAYNYTCTRPAGLPAPDGGYPAIAGTAEAGRGNFAQLPLVPVGTTCKLTGTKPDTSAKPYLKVAGNWVPWDVDKLGFYFYDNMDFSQANKTKLAVKDTDPGKGTFEITLDGTTKQGVVLYTVYSNGTKVRIYKATAPKPNGQVVPDATFSLYERNADESAGTPIELVPVEGQSGVYESKTELPPGNYLLGNTNAGKNAGERFPFGWKFAVALDPADQKAEQDTAVKLDPEAKSSGLIATYAPDNTVKAWQIELADVRVGNLPLTGGYLPWLWLVGISLVAASAAVMWHRRRE